MYRFRYYPEGCSPVLEGLETTERPYTVVVTVQRNVNGANYLLQCAQLFRVKAGQHMADHHVFLRKLAKLYEKKAVDLMEVIGNV